MKRGEIGLQHTSIFTREKRDLNGTLFERVRTIKTLEREKHCSLPEIESFSYASLACIHTKVLLVAIVQTQYHSYLITTEKNFQLLFNFGRSLCVLCHVRSVQLNKITSTRQLASSMSEKSTREEDYRPVYKKKRYSRLTLPAY